MIRRGVNLWGWGLCAPVTRSVSHSENRGRSTFDVIVAKPGLVVSLSVECCRLYVHFWLLEESSPEETEKVGHTFCGTIFVWHLPIEEY